MSTVALDPGIVHDLPANGGEAPSRRPRWPAALLGLCLLVGPLANVVVVGLIVVALAADPRADDEVDPAW